jgi:hypothetical protein
MLTVVIVRTTDRIPGFAICARCGARRLLGSCPSCGLLVCGDCRGARECAVCHGERAVLSARYQRRAQRREVGKRAAVVAMVAVSGVTGLSAAFIPAGPMCTGALAPVAVELRVGADTKMTTPVALEAAPPPWNEALGFHCFQARSDLTCCIVDVP